MKKEIKESADNKKGFFSPEKSKELKNIWDSSFNEGEGIGINSEDAKELETIKIILAAIMDKNNLESLSSLTSGQVDDINDAMIMYHVFQDPLILIYAEHRLKLNRSLTKDHKNLLSIFSEIAGRTSTFLEENIGKGILGNRFK